MRLYDYFRSSAAWRVRIALRWKGISYESVRVDLGQGEQQQGAYRALNPQALVPTWCLDDGTQLSQSLAILEYLEETQPEPRLLPTTAVARARVRSLAQLVACDVHPLQNLRVRQRLQAEHGFDGEAAERWCRHWIALGLDALEARLASEPETGRFCHGDGPTLADVALVPQLYNAVRYGCDLDRYPTLLRIQAACAALAAFAETHPDRQAHPGVQPNPR